MKPPLFYRDVEALEYMENARDQTAQAPTATAEAETGLEADTKALALKNSTEQQSTSHQQEHHLTSRARQTMLGRPGEKDAGESRRADSDFGGERDGRTSNRYPAHTEELYSRPRS